MTKVLIKKKSNLITMPKYETLGSSGMDLAAFINDKIIIKPQEKIEDSTIHAQKHGEPYARIHVVYVVYV